jgi:hypothetical protein
MLRKNGNGMYPKKRGGMSTAVSYTEPLHNTRGVMEKEITSE